MGGNRVSPQKDKRFVYVILGVNAVGLKFDHVYFALLKHALFAFISIFVGIFWVIRQMLYDGRKAAHKSLCLVSFYTKQTCADDKDCQYCGSSSCDF